MSFDVGAEAYDCYLGRYSAPLAARFAGLVNASPGLRALDVGCGPGSLTAGLVARLGAQSVAAVDPSASFVSAVHALLPDVEVRKAAAEKLLYPDNAFDLTLAQLVVHFMADPEAGIRDLGSGAQDESRLPGVCDGHLVELFQRAGLTPAAQATIAVWASFRDVTAWWQPFTLGVGPAGAYVASLGPGHRARLRARCTQLLLTGRFDVEATAWTVSARIRDRGPVRRGRLPGPAQRALLDAAAHT